MEKVVRLIIGMMTTAISVLVFVLIAPFAFVAALLD